MRKFLPLMMLLLFAMPDAFAQRGDDDASATAAVAGTTADAQGAAAPAGAGADAADDAGAVDMQAPRSGFGQVMSVLTGLLQDAAQREATGRGEGLVLDNPAIEISVTPVEGRTSLLRAPAERPARERRRAAGKRQLAGGAPR